MHNNWYLLGYWVVPYFVGGQRVFIEHTCDSISWLCWHMALNRQQLLANVFLKIFLLTFFPQDLRFPYLFCSQTPCNERAFSHSVNLVPIRTPTIKTRDKNLGKIEEKERNLRAVGSNFVLVHGSGCSLAGKFRKKRIKGRILRVFWVKFFRRTL